MGKRDDGYHLLRSIVVFPEFGDKISIEKSEHFALSIHGEFSDGLDAKQNSILDAVHWFEGSHGVEARVNITVEKNLPVMAGLGGGTADCAATIHGLCALYEVDLPEPQSLVGLGADVPVSCYGNTVLMEGVGEKLLPISHTNTIYMVMVNPMRSVSTRSVFANMNLDFIKTQTEENVDNLPWQLVFPSNDMQVAAIGLCPEIADCLRIVKDAGAMITQMSGSGATVFGICDSAEHANHVAKKIKLDRPHYWVQSTSVRPSDGQPYRIG